MKILPVPAWSLVLILVALAAAVGSTRAADGTRPPNIILIVADDLGYGELGVYGNKEIPTPNIDALAAAGVRFTDGYVTCPVCAPTRAGLLTGRYQQRFGFETNPGPEQRASDKFGLPRSERTLAEKLKEAGYATGMFGKWHLGYKAELQPQRRGFDEFFGFLSGAHKYVPGGRATESILRNGEPVEEKEYLTDAFAREAAAFIGRNKDRTFFLYVPFNAVHAPMETTKPYLERFGKIEGEKRRKFAAMLSALDDGVGRVLSAVKEAGQEENTLVFFISDNGGPTPQTTSGNGPLSGTKGQVREGGIRVPFMMKWPGHAPAGMAFQQPVLSLDIHATALAAAGIGPDSKSGAPLDGRDLLPHVGGKIEAAPHEAIFWRFGGQWAVRKGDWKLLSQGNPRQAGSGTPRLYNLREDLGENKDLAAVMPEKVAELRRAFDEWNAKNIDPLWGRNANADQPQKTPAKPAGG